MAKKRNFVYTTPEEWRKEGRRRFGPDPENWKFICPACGRVNTGQEFKDAGAEPDSMYCECIGRYDKSKGCNWAAYGLFDICTIEVAGNPVFDFAEADDEGERK